MSIDRAATLRQAEKLLRLGKLDQAIAEYLRLVEDQPRDWNTANVLGDLYLRAGDTDRAIEQFTRIADSLRLEGFLPRASALYKKILKLRPADDHALVQAGELAASQGLLADARAFLTSAIAARRHRGDQSGVLALVVRLGALDKSDVEARLAAARARRQLDDVPGAVRDFTDLGLMLVEQGRDAEALTPLQEANALDPGDGLVARELARILVQSGRPTDAVSLLSPEVLDADAELAVLAADLRLRAGEVESGLELIDTVLARDAALLGRVSDLAVALVPLQPDTAYLVADRVVSASIAGGDAAGGAEVLERFLASLPGHLPALTRLVDVCVDLGLGDRISRAQAGLADAYLAAGLAGEARYVAEDLVAREPWERAHVMRLRAAHAADGSPDPDRAVADWLCGASTFGYDDETDLDDEASTPGGPGADAFVVPAVSSDAPVNAPRPVERAEGNMSGLPSTSTPWASAHNPHAIDLDMVFGSSQRALPSVEEDLSVVLDDFHVRESAVPDRPVAPPPPPPAAADIDAVFAQMREAVTHRSADESAEVAYTRGTAMFEAGDLDLSIEHLRLAARSPRWRFAAASMLARVHERAHRAGEAIEWLGHAVDVPGISPTDRFETLLRMADLLEASGETAGALAVCLELQTEAGDYKGLAARVTRLSRASGG